MTHSPKLIAHGQSCPKCHASDTPMDMCRIGRRLFVAWFRTLDQDEQVMTLFGMPQEMQGQVKDLVGTLDDLVLDSTKPQGVS